ncbi:hypothetical protein N8261_06565, partial [Flavobacteriaceae bacterium]|nr:hypothetical protein [Flavobacteriaceae bacterium]
SNMVNLVIIDKTGEMKVCKYNVDKDEIYKKCKFKKADNFEHRHTWNTKKDKYSFNSVSLYARNTGKANTENKYDLPPPIDNILYFGCIALMARDNNGEVDLSVEEWGTFYEDLFGGFENLADTIKQDDEEEDELENVAKEMKTKSGYLKDDFVVEDNLVEDVSGSDEGTWEDETSELDYEEYSYSDED